jgi:hypothetical protein
LALATQHANLLAVNINVNSNFSAYAASGILAHYDHPQVPIGIKSPISGSHFFDQWSYDVGEYASKIGYQHREEASEIRGIIPWGYAENATQDPVKLYRRVLAEADDHSVTIVSIGFFENVSVSSSFGSLGGNF